MMKHVALGLVALCALTACATEPMFRLQPIEVPHRQYVAIDSDYTDPLERWAAPEKRCTWVDAKTQSMIPTWCNEDRETVLEACMLVVDKADEDRAAVAKLSNRAVKGK